MSGFGAIVLAGGGARRLGGADKPGLSLGGRPLLHRVLDAVADAYPRIVVGPPRPVPEGVLTTREEPPGGGPVAALAAGLALLDSVAPGPDGDVALVAVLAGDLPFLRPEAVGALRAAATGDAALYTDGERRQLLCAVWRVTALRRRLAAVGAAEGAALRQLYADAEVTELTSENTPPPWYDCDTEADLRRAEEWLRETQ